MKRVPSLEVLDDANWISKAKGSIGSPRMGSASCHGITMMFTIRNTVTKIQTGIWRAPWLYTHLERGLFGDFNPEALHGAQRRVAQSQISDAAMPQSVWMEAPSEAMHTITGRRVLG